MAISIPWIIVAAVIGIAYYATGSWASALISSSLYVVIAITVTVRFLILRRGQEVEESQEPVGPEIANLNLPPERRRSRT